MPQVEVRCKWCSYPIDEDCDSWYASEGPLPGHDDEFECLPGSPDGKHEPNKVAYALVGGAMAAAILGKSWRHDHNCLTLGQIIEYLEQQKDQTVRVRFGFGHPHSYRGYYDDLAVESAYGTTIAEMLEMFKSCVGAVLTGYKGGNYLMTPNTGVWIAHYGDTGAPLDADALGRALFGERLVGDDAGISVRIVDSEATDG